MPRTKTKTKEPVVQRSVQQNKALHKDCRMIAEKLNKKGLRMDGVLKEGISFDWTAKSVAAMLDLKVDEDNRGMLEVIAKTLNEAGITPVVTIQSPKVDCAWNTQRVKEFIWRPIQRFKFGKESTTQLDRHEGEFGEIHDEIMRRLGERYGVEYHEFPNEQGLAEKNHF